MAYGRALALALAAAAAVASCGQREQGLREIRVVATEMRFEPAVLRLAPGERVRIVLENRGTQVHEFESDALAVKEVEVAPGKARAFVLTAPKQPGEYPFVCDKPGHLEAGMAGKVVVAP